MVESGGRGDFWHVLRRIVDGDVGAVMRPSIEQRKQMERQRIEQAAAAYLARGGTVTVLEPEKPCRLELMGYDIDPNLARKGGRGAIEPNRSQQKGGRMDATHANADKVRKMAQPYLDAGWTKNAIEVRARTSRGIIGYILRTPNAQITPKQVRRMERFVANHNPADAPAPPRHRRRA